MAKRRKFIRPSGFRDSKLIIIAAEGQVTEKKYFEGIKKYISTPKVHVEILERSTTASDPESVMSLLEKFRSEYNLRKGKDSLWLVIDVDRWGSRKLSEICERCYQKGYALAISNPCFELWLLFHIQGLDAYTNDEITELQINAKDGNRSRLEIELVRLLGSYSKTNPDLNFFLNRLSVAIRNAHAAERNPRDRWPNQIGSRVYLLVEEILSTNI